MRLLLVEDDLMLGDSLRASLIAEGYAVDWLKDGGEVLPALRSISYDIIVLDQQLPGKNGIEVVTSLRAEGIETPVLFLTVCNSTSQKMTGLDAGADDYLTKPADLGELFARLRALLRRKNKEFIQLKAGDLEIDQSSRAVYFQGEKIAGITIKEFTILMLLMRNHGQFVTKETLLEACNSWDEEVNSNTVEVYISHLRKRFGRDRIETMRGVGYRLI